MAESLTVYLADLEARRRSPNTLAAVRRDVRQFITWWEAHTRHPFDPLFIRPADLNAWLTDREQHGAAPTSINRALASLHGFAGFCVRQGWMPDDVTADVRGVPMQEQGPRALPVEAVTALLREVRSTRNERQRVRDEAALAMLIYGGLRVQEVCDVQLRDLDLDGGVVVVRKGKGGKFRRVPLHADALPLLRRYLRVVRCPDGLPPVGSDAEREPLLLGVRGTSRTNVTPRSLQRMVARYGKRAAARLEAQAEQAPTLERAAELHWLAHRLAQVTPHTLRHSLARRMLHGGAKLTEVRAVLGHSRLDTTAQYLVANEDDLRDAIGKAGVS